MVNKNQSAVLVYHAAKLFAANQEIAIDGNDYEEHRNAAIVDLLAGEVLVKYGDLERQVLFFE